MFAVPCRIDRRRSKSCQESHQRTVKGLFLWVGFMAGKRLIYGVAMNDADYCVNRYVIENGKNKRVWICPMYLTWRNMIMRCYSPGCQEKHPTYAKCSVVPEWLLFSNFRSWMEGEDWNGKELDKDILSPGNKVYGPDLCVFVISRLNAFLTDHGAARGEWPIGVSIEKDCGRFKASCSNPFTARLENLGRYARPEEAHMAWRRRKHQHSLKYAEMQSDPRIADALRTRYLTTEDINNAIA